MNLKLRVLRSLDEKLRATFWFFYICSTRSAEALCADHLDVEDVLVDDVSFKMPDRIPGQSKEV